MLRDLAKFWFVIHELQILRAVIRDFQLLSPEMREFLTLLHNLSNYQTRNLLTS